MIRNIHLFLGMFMTPWVMMYAASTIVVQHRDLFTGHERRVEPEFETVREVIYLAEVAKGEDANAIASRILEYLSLEGRHRVRGSLEAGIFEVRRDRPIGSYCIAWGRESAILKVERQEFGLSFFLEALHRRSGFVQPYWATSAVRRNVAGMFSGERAAAGRLFKKLSAKVNS